MTAKISLLLRPWITSAIQPDITTPHINLNALVGNATTETLCIFGAIKNKDIVILIVGGSTYNFMQDIIVKYLGLQVSQSPCSQVTVDRRDKLQWTRTCSKVPVILANTYFKLTSLFYPLAALI